MTSTSTIGVPQQQAEARTIADVAQRSPELVNEVWCRKVFRQTLQALELQHAMHLPHAPIGPHTLGIAPNGDPVLIPAPESAGEPGEAADVQALGAVIHYAITRELPPAGPLRGRSLEGYSDSLVGAVDRCMAPNPAERPQSIDELRNLLGIVSLGPPIVAPSAQHLQAHGYDRPYQPRPDTLPVRWQRWLLIGAAACVLLAAGAALVALLHDTVNRDTVVLQLPPAEPPAKTLDANETLVQAPPAQPQAPAPAPAQPAGPATPPDAAAPALAPRPRPAQQPPQQPAQAQARAAAPAPQPTAPPAPAAPGQNTTYKLVIEPWGTVYVDGDERGVSPPLKRLTLAPGLHTIRIVNPSFQDHVVKVEAGKAASGRIAHDFNDE